MSMWAEVYGTAHLGAIRSLVQALMVAISAMSPFIFGELFDIGVTIETVAGGHGLIYAGGDGGSEDCVPRVERSASRSGEDVMMSDGPNTDQAEVLERPWRRDLDHATRPVQHHAAPDRAGGD